MKVSDAISLRRTIRKFKNEAIDKKLIIDIINGARVSPSAGNMQSLKYSIIDSEEERKAMFPLIKYAGYINDWNPDFSETPASFIAVLNDTDIRKAGALTECDCGIAMMAISLMAVEKGLDTCILGAIDRKRIAEVLNINSKYELMYLIGIGKSDQKSEQYDCSDNVKYTMDTDGNFNVPKRTLNDVIIDRTK